MRVNIYNSKKLFINIIFAAIFYIINNIYISNKNYFTTTVLNSESKYCFDGEVSTVLHRVEHVV